MYRNFEYFADRDEGKDAFMKVNKEYDEYRARYLEQGRIAWQIFMLMQKERSNSKFEHIHASLTHRKHKVDSSFTEMKLVRLNTLAPTKKKIGEL